MPMQSRIEGEMFEAASPRDVPFHMKVYRKWREGRRRSSFTYSSQSSPLLDDSSRVPSISSSGSWEFETTTTTTATSSSQFSTPTHRYVERLSLDEAVTEASTVPSHVEEKDSPTNSTLPSPTQPLSMVVYEQPSSPLPLPDSLRVWFETADAVIRSNEMQALFGCSRDVVVSAAMTGRDVACFAGGVVVHTALLPVTLPLHVAATTTHLVVGVAGNVLHTIVGGDQSEAGEQTSSESPIDSFVHHVCGVIPFMLHAAGRVTEEIGSVAAGVVAPVLGGESHEQTNGETPTQHRFSPTKACASGESSAERENILDRLRLDFVPTTPTKAEASPTPQTPYSRATASDFSKYLLRVDDIYVLVSPKDPSPVHQRSKRALFIDLGAEFSEESITKDALSQLAERGLHMAATNTSAHVHIYNFSTNPAISVKWKPEGATARQVRKIANLHATDYYNCLRSQIMVWSGKYEGPTHRGSENPLFLARGVVRRSPKEFFDMLWDSNRTGEYNKFSLGRSDILTVDDAICRGGLTASKVIRSDTKVPFTGMTVSLTALMHAQKLNEGDEEGFVIVSRSLDTGMAGCHVGSKSIENNSKNEILLGVNIMRPVPGHPDLTDLMSLSQVSSSMVPQFLAFRIGMMGLEDFFNNVRK